MPPPLPPVPPPLCPPRWPQAAIFAGTWIGSITTTGSIIAYLKLDGRMPSKPLALPGKNLINAAAAGASVLSAVAFMNVRCGAPPTAHPPRRARGTSRP